MDSFIASKRSSVHPRHDDSSISSHVDSTADSIGRPHAFTIELAFAVANFPTFTFAD
jgi:hypothetical protein